MDNFKLQDLIRNLPEYKSFDFTNERHIFSLMLDYNVTFYNKNRIVGGEKYGAEVFVQNHNMLVTDKCPHRVIVKAVLLSVGAIYQSDLGE